MAANPERAHNGSMAGLQMKVAGMVKLLSGLVAVVGQQNRLAVVHMGLLLEQEHMG
jgi:hypothetical protein